MLSASNNMIDELPEGIENLIKLEILHLNDNKIKSLPKRIGQLSNLKKLFVHNN